MPSASALLASGVYWPRPQRDFRPRFKKNWGL